jgi:multicomponent K+:H+ antiporter subunit E
MSILARLVPDPLLSAALLVLWVLLARSASAGQMVLGLVLAIGVPLVTARLRPTPFRIRRPWLVVRFVGTVGRDVVVSNFQVAWGVVAWRWRPPRPQFVVIPLELRDPLGLAALAMVTTVVPGTVWSELAVDRSVLMLHAWDVDDEDAYVARFKARYEAPLRDIFE